MLYMPTEASKPKRLQGSFVSDAEIERLVYFWGNQRQIEVSSVNFDEVAERPSGAQIAAPPDPLLEEAKRLAQEYKHVSTSFLQRRLRIGYPRAARLMEALQQAGLVEETPPEGEN
jgi:S-DNA-T family DNA segregation ATPase FtsK/SpoIIIE